MKILELVGQILLNCEEQKDGWVVFKFSGGWQIHVKAESGLVIVHPNGIKELT